MSASTSPPPTMEWLLVQPSRKRPAQTDHTPIDQLIRASRERVVAKAEELPALRERCKEIDDKLAMLPDRRRFIRMGLDLRDAKAEVEKQIDHIESGAHIREFDATAALFTRAYHANESRRRTDERTDVAHGFRAVTNASTRGEVVEEFLTTMDSKPPRISLTRNDVCPQCNAPMKIVLAKAIVTCVQCGRSAAYLDATVASCSFDEQIEFSHFSYKRINHFGEWMTNIQGCETYEVPQSVLDQVCGELHRQRVREEDITFRRVREVLKTLRLRRQYEHTTQITCRLTNRPFPKLSNRTMEMSAIPFFFVCVFCECFGLVSVVTVTFVARFCGRCKLMFRACQAPFARAAATVCQGRKNFMSYSYILYQFLYILGESDAILDAFTLLKGRDKRARMDEVFSIIAKELDWSFRPTT